MTANAWPTQADAIEFYGDPRFSSFAAEHLTDVACPWKLFYGSEPVTKIRINKRCAASLERVLAAVWDKLGKSQAAIAAHGYDKYSGSYNYRPIRGQNVELSMHAFGAAIDWDAGENPSGHHQGRFKDSDILIEAFKAEGWVWGGDWKVPCDGMHVQAARVR